MSRPEGSHRRYNPLLDEWVLCSPGRLARPWRGAAESVDAPSSAPYALDCPLCPGNRRASGARNPAYETVFAFDNDFPAFAEGALPAEPPHPLLVARPERGRCRVLCYSPRHDTWLARMEPAAVVAVVDAWAEEAAALLDEGRYGYVQVFENRGAAMGCSDPHPHGQIWAVGAVPTIPARKDDRLRAYYDAHGEDLLGALLAEELARDRRVVLANETWVVLVPFWAVWPFETLVLPRRRVAHLSALDAAERAGLADALRRLLVRYDNLFETPFPYSMGWHGAPRDALDEPAWRLHGFFAPPLLRSARVRKFLVGYELAAEPQRDLTAEEAAGRLRAVSERHYLDR